MNDLRERVARAIEARVLRDGFATHEELADAAIAAGVGADTELRRAATDALAAYDAIGMGPTGWCARDRNAFAALRAVLAPTPPAPPEIGEAETTPANTEKHDA